MRSLPVLMILALAACAAGNPPPGPPKEDLAAVPRHAEPGATPADGERAAIVRRLTGPGLALLRAEVAGLCGERPEAWVAVVAERLSEAAHRSAAGPAAEPAATAGRGLSEWYGVVGMAIAAAHEERAAYGRGACRTLRRRPRLLADLDALAGRR